MKKLLVVLKVLAFFVVMVIFIKTLSTGAKLSCGAFATENTFPILPVSNLRSLQSIESTVTQKVLRRSKEFKAKKRTSLKNEKRYCSWSPSCSYNRPKFFVTAFKVHLGPILILAIKIRVPFSFCVSLQASFYSGYIKYEHLW